MNVEFTNAFNKQLSEIRDEKLLLEISDCVRQIIAAKSIKDINQIKKLKGFKTAYRIRTGTYRIGVFIEKGEAVFAAILHRKDIYRKFP